MPLLRAVLIAAWNEPQDPLPPRLMLMTRAGLALAGTPETLPPEDQTIASTMSEVEPPQRPSTRTGTTLAP